MKKMVIKFVLGLLTAPISIMIILMLLVLALAIAFIVMIIGMLTRTILIVIATLTFGLAGFTIATIMTKTDITRQNPFAIDVTSVESEEFATGSTCEFYEVADGYTIEEKSSAELSLESEEAAKYMYKLILKLPDETNSTFIAHWPAGVSPTNSVKSGDRIYSVIGEYANVDDTVITTYAICESPQVNVLTYQQKFKLWYAWVTDDNSYNAFTTSKAKGLDVDGQPEGDFKATDIDIVKSWLTALRSLDQPPELNITDESNNLEVDGVLITDYNCVQRDSNSNFSAGDIIILPTNEVGVVTKDENSRYIYTVIVQNANPPHEREFVHEHQQLDIEAEIVNPLVWECSTVREG
jgi:hypothetical protein